MKKLVKLFLVIMASSLMITAAACGGGGEGDTPDGDNPNVVTPGDDTNSGGETVLYTYELNKTSVSIEEGKTEQLNVTSAPEKTLTVTWETSDASVATVDNGLVTAVAAGTAKIVAKVDGKELECTVTVTAKIPEKVYSLNKTEATIKLEEGLQLIISPTPAEGVEVEWISVDTSVAEVTQNGYVKAVDYGETVISVSVGDETLTCDITVPIEYEYEISETTKDLYIEETFTLQIISTPVNPDLQVAWKTSDAEVATVVDGLVTAVGEGEATITATVEGVDYTCEVTVTIPNYEYDVDSTLSVDRGSTAEINVSVTPNKTLNLSFVSADTEVATVNDEGVVTGVKAGNTTITATVDGEEYEVAVTVNPAVTATSENKEITSHEIINISSDPEYNVVYWEHYGDSHIDQKKDAEDIISNSEIESGNPFYDYKAHFNWTDGKDILTKFGKNCGGLGKQSEFNYYVTVPAGESVLRIYTGAWRSTNSTEIYDGEKLIAKAEEFVAGDQSVNMAITFNIVSDEAKTLTVKMSPEHRGEAGNVSLVAVVVLNGESTQEQATTAVNLDSNTTFTGYNESHINLTLKGTKDWLYFNYDHVHDEKKNGTDILYDTLVWNGTSKEWNYMAAFNWEDGTEWGISPIDNDCNNQGSNNYISGHEVAINVKVDANTDKLYVYTGGWNDSVHVQMNDKFGNTLICSDVAQSGGDFAHEMAFSVNATEEDILTVIVYCDNGSGIASLAAVATSIKGYTESEFTLTETATVVADKTVQLEVNANPAKEVNVRWSTSDAEVATVDANGLVTGHKAGTATITALVRGVTLTCNITVYEYTLNRTELSLDVEATDQLTVTSNPEQDNLDIVWSSSDSAVATVVNGLVTAIGAGQANITATVGGETLTCSVSVIGDYEYSISQTEALLNITKNNSVQLSVNVTPNKTDVVTEWSSSDDTIATVEDGLVTAKAPGTVIITVTADTNFTYTCTVTVEVAIGSTSKNTEISDGSIIDISEDTEYDVLYWEHYDNNFPDQMVKAPDIINNPDIMTNGQDFFDYKASINWTNGKNVAAWSGAGNNHGKGMSSKFEFTIDLGAGLSVIRLYTGAWQATNSTQIYVGDRLIISAEKFTAGGSSLNYLVEFTLTCEIATTITVKMTPENSNGNISLVAVVVLGNAEKSTTASLKNKTEMVNIQTSQISLSEIGTADWFYANYDMQYDSKNGGTAIDEDSCKGRFGEAWQQVWDYRALFNWTDGTNWTTQPLDNDLGDASLNGTNNAFAGDSLSIDVTVDNKTDVLSMWVGGYNNAKVIVKILDENGIMLVKHEVGTAGVNDHIAYQLDFTIEAIKSEKLTVVIYREGGQLCDFAALAVSEKA